MIVLVTGANGQVGWELCRRAQPPGLTVHGFDHAQMDITRPKQTAETIARYHPDLVVNAAAYTNVDQAETNTQQAFSVNQDGPAILATCCAELDIPLIHLSTDYVFDGSAVTPYRQDDALSPLGIYGHSKAAGEEEVRDRLHRHIILRTSWVYGIHGHNFVKTMLKFGATRDTLRVVNDQFGCPTSAGDIADTVLAIATHVSSWETPIWGTYHYCGQGIITWFDFAEEIFRIAKRLGYAGTPTVDAIPTSEYPTKTTRPVFSALDCSRLLEVFQLPQKPWQESLGQVLKELLSDD